LTTHAIDLLSESLTKVFVSIHRSTIRKRLVTLVVFGNVGIGLFLRQLRTPLRCCRLNAAPLICPGRAIRRKVLRRGDIPPVDHSNPSNQNCHHFSYLSKTESSESLPKHPSPFTLFRVSHSPLLDRRD
jgi:hypothetical protein